MRKLGVIVNPIAGLGGKVGLKGTDGLEVRRRARELGAEPESLKRATEALTVVSKLKDSLTVFSYPREMGEDECRQADLRPNVLGSILSGATTPQDTVEAARRMMAQGVDLLLFAGGDGTARDICNAVGDRVPALGIPTGVKMHSAVYAVTPKSAGEAAALFLQGRLTDLREAEVMDIDEDVFREDALAAKLYGYLRVPQESRHMQCLKAGGNITEAEALRGIASDVIESMDDPDCYYAIGPGTTTRAITNAFGLPKTLLGVDLVRNKQLVIKDASERDLLTEIKGHDAKIIVTVIGGQGHIFGRGNQQLSPSIVRLAGKNNIRVIATKSKLASLAGRPILVDTGDEGLNQELSGYIRVTVGYHDYIMYKVGYC